MKKNAFIKYYKKSLKFHLKNLTKNDDVEFIDFIEGENNSFVTIKENIILSLVVLLTLLNDKKINFSCGLIYEETDITGVEVCINNLDMDKLDEFFSF